MRTPIEDDCFRQGREAAQRGEPQRTTAPMFWSQSMIDAYDDGFREGLAPADIARMERAAAFAQRWSAPRDQSADLFPS